MPHVVFTRKTISQPTVLLLHDKIETRGQQNELLAHDVRQGPGKYQPDGSLVLHGVFCHDDVQLFLFVALVYLQSRVDGLVTMDQFGVYVI